MLKPQLVNKVFGRQARYPLKQSIPVVERWFAMPLGRAVLAAQKQCLSKILNGLYGSQALQLSMLREPSFKTLDCAAPWAMGPMPGGVIDVLCDDEQLPVATQSMDIAVVHHYLEYSHNPHYLLKELTRVIMPSGYIVIVGFNPYSFLGVRSIFGRFQHQGIWHNHPISAKRIADWLKLLDFTVTDVQYGFYQPPINAFVQHEIIKRIGRFLNRRQWPFGGFYVVVAKKQISPLTPSHDYLQLIRKSMIPIMEPSLYTPPNKKINRADNKGVKEYLI
ncbi:MAG: methyltransferase domain-containing protein [Pseudomonadales bacterium]|nr:methyltransferase domain-containing protein [Pseudomonadales bacterium]